MSNERKIRTLVHIEAGDDLWTPTDKELTELVDQFMSALNTDEGDVGVVATRNAVKVQIHEVEATAFVNANKAVPPTNEYK
jgi:hypothetical protein